MGRNSYPRQRVRDSGTWGCGSSLVRMAAKGAQLLTLLFGFGREVGAAAAQPSEEEASLSGALLW